MRVLLTGAHGFIGSHVVAALRGAGHTIIACVCTPRGRDEVACDLARDLAARGADSGTPLPPAYFRAMRVWFVLGWLAFLAVIAIFRLMIAKPALW